MRLKDPGRLPYRILGVGLPALLALAPLPFAGRTEAASSVLCAGAFVLSLCALLADRGAGPVPSAGPLCLLLALVLLQVVPLPGEILTRLDPAAAWLRQRISLGADWAPAPLSLAPAASLAAIGRLSAVLGIFFAASVLARRPGGTRRIAMGLCAAGSIQAIYGLADFLSGAHRIFGYERQAYLGRLTGTYVNPNHVAGLFELALPATLGLALALDPSSPALPARRDLRRRLVQALSDPRLGQRRILGLIMGVLSVALLFSLSRAGIFLTGAACLSALVLAGRPAWRRGAEARARPPAGSAPHPSGRGIGRRLAWAGASVGIAVISVAPLAYDQGLRLAGQYRAAPTDLFAPGGRMEIWKTAMEIFRDHPLFGTGLASFGSTVSRYRAPAISLRWEEVHNDLLQWLVETGLIGAAIAGWALLRAAGAAGRAFPPSRQWEAARSLRIALACGCAAFLLHELLDFNAQIPANAFAIAAAAAACLAPPIPEAPHPLRSAEGSPRAKSGVLLAALASAGALWGTIHPGDASLHSVARARAMLVEADRQVADLAASTRPSAQLAEPSRPLSSTSSAGPDVLARQARASLLRAVEGNPANAEAQILLARLQRHRALFHLSSEARPGLPDPAGARLSLAVELDPYRPDLRIGVLREHVARREKAAALADLKALAQRGGGAVWHSFPIVWGLIPDPDLVVRFLPGETSEMRLAFVDFLRTIGRRAEAERLLRALLVSYPESAAETYDRLSLVLMQDGRAEEAAGLGEAILASGRQSSSERARVCCQLARALVAAGWKQKGVGRIREALTLWPDEPGLQAAAAEIYLACDLPEEARERYEFLLWGGAPEQFIAPREKSLHAGLGRAYDQLRKRDAALREWREVSRLDPSDSEARDRITALSHGF